MKLKWRLMHFLRVVIAGAACLSMLRSCTFIWTSDDDDDDYWLLLMYQGRYTRGEAFVGTEPEPPAK